MSEQQLTKEQQRYAEILQEVNSDYGPIAKFIPADDGVNVYFRFAADDRLWYSNNSYADGFVMPVSDTPERHV